jgi:ribosome-binding factor A
MPMNASVLSGSYRPAVAVQACHTPRHSSISRPHSTRHTHDIFVTGRYRCNGSSTRERMISNVRCMANARRMARVSKQIEREIGLLFVSDKVVQAAVCPERRRGIDDGMSALASVTEVEVSNDLQVAKVYLSIYSDESGKAVAMRGLKNIEGYVRKHIGRNIRLRLTPEIRFILDDSIERSERVLSLLKRVESINAGDAPPPPVTIAEDVDDDFDVFYEDGDGDQVVISSVDLGFYDDEDNSATTASVRKPVASEKDGAVSLSDDDVEEMLTFFKQDATKIQKRGKKNTRYT